MFRILVLSDSHSDTASLRYAIKNEAQAQAVLFLGDGLNDYEEINFPGEIYSSAVRGNCDSSFAPYPLFREEIFAGKRIYMSHGHMEHVKYGTTEFEETARLHNADIALHGHTHIPYTDYRDGMYIMNPGSVRENSCGIIDITDTGIMCYTKRIITIQPSDSRYYG